MQRIQIKKNKLLINLFTISFAADKSPFIIFFLLSFVVGLTLTFKHNSFDFMKKIFLLQKKIIILKMILKKNWSILQTQKSKFTLAWFRKSQEIICQVFFGEKTSRSRWDTWANRLLVAVASNTIALSVYRSGRC